MNTVINVIRMNDGWMRLDTNQFIPFGDIAASFYNETKENITKIESIIFKIYNVGSNNSRIITKDVLDTYCRQEQDILISLGDDIVVLLVSEVKFADNCVEYDPDCHKKMFKNYRYYLPLSKTMVAEIFANDIMQQYYIDLTEYLTYFNRFCNVIDHLISKYDKTFYSSAEEYREKDANIINSWMSGNQPEITVIVKKCENKFYTCYQVTQIQQMIFFDLVEMLDLDYILDSCPICGKAYIERDKRNNFCQICAKDKDAQKIYNDKKRTKSPRYIHKKICDMLRNRGEDYNAFSAESDYYWDVINDREVPENRNYDSSIQTPKDYMMWLQVKHDEFRRRKKKNPLL